MKQVRPFGVGQDDAVIASAGAMRDRGEHERFGAEGREPLGMAVDVGELGATNVVVIQNRADLSGDEREAVTSEESLCPVPSVGPEAPRTPALPPFSPPPASRKYRL